MRKITAKRNRINSRAIPPGAVVYAQDTSIIVDGVRQINLHGRGGPYTGFIAKKGSVEVSLPSATFIGVSPTDEFVAWDGKEYLLMPTMESIQETDNLTFIARVDDPKDWSPLHQQVAAYKKIKELMEGPHEVIPESLVRRALAQQYGIKPEEVTWKQIRSEVSGLLRYYPAITLVPSDATTQKTEQSTPVQPNPLGAVGRPPLHAITLEQIDQLLHRVDQQHWPNIISSRIKKHYPPDVPVPAPAPQTLMGNIRWYASMLYKTEADQYGQFRSDGRYPAWLSRLSERVIGRVLTALERLDDGDPDSFLLSIHGLRKEEIEKELKTFLWEIGRQYEQGTAPGQVKVSTPTPSPAKPEPVENSNPEESVAEQIKHMKDECRLTHQSIAEALDVDVRQIFRHLHGTMPRAAHIAAYEKLFSEKSGKTVTIKSATKTSEKGHKKS